MMNEYYGFGGRGSRQGLDRAPYRRPASRLGLPGNMAGHTHGQMPGQGTHTNNGRTQLRSGCGCGLSSEARGTSRPEPRHTLPAFHADDGRSGCGCGCHGGTGSNTSSCKHLMEQIRAVDFALYETILYLDVYPHSCDALETYHKLRAQSQALHDEYEASCGPITAFGNQSNTSWDWMSKPCPWEYDAD